ncbi:MAG: lytic transglycosylase domain-containing protein [Stackebrandtia sp.]
MSNDADDQPDEVDTSASDEESSPHAVSSRWTAVTAAVRGRLWATGLLGLLVLVVGAGVWAGFGVAGADDGDTAADVAATVSPRDPDEAGRDGRPQPDDSESAPSPTTTKPSSNDPRTQAPKEDPEPETVEPESAAGCDDFSGNQAIACGLLGDEGFGTDQMDCLVPLWDNESGWNTSAANPSGAYGIPQALPGDKMASAGEDWADNAATQITWGLGYIGERYGDPCGAWGFWQSNNYY